MNVTFSVILKFPLSDVLKDIYLCVWGYVLPIQTILWPVSQSQCRSLVTHLSLEKCILNRERENVNK